MNDNKKKEEIKKIFSDNAKPINRMDTKSEASNTSTNGNTINITGNNAVTGQVAGGDILNIKAEKVVVPRGSR